MSLMSIVCTGGDKAASLDELPWSVHPTQFTVRGSPYAGCVYGSLLLIAGFAALHAAVTAIAAESKFRNVGAEPAAEPDGPLGEGLTATLGCDTLGAVKGTAAEPQGSKGGSAPSAQGGAPQPPDPQTPWEAACAATRFPGLLVLIAAWLYLGVAFSCFHMMMAPGELPKGYIFIASVVTLCFNCGFMVWMLSTTHPRYLKGVYSPPMARAQWWRRWFLGRRQWTSTADSYVERYGLAFDAWRPPHHRWFATVELGHQIPIAFYTAMMSQGWDACIVQNTSLGFALLVYLLTLLFVRPQVAPFEWGVFTVNAALQFLGTVFRGIAFLHHDSMHWGFGAAAWCLVLALWVVTCWSLTQLVLVLLDMCGRLPPPPEGPSGDESMAFPECSDKCSVHSAAADHSAVADAAETLVEPEQHLSLSYVGLPIQHSASLLPPFGREPTGATSDGDLEAATPRRRSPGEDSPRRRRRLGRRDTAEGTMLRAVTGDFYGSGSGTGSFRGPPSAACAGGRGHHRPDVATLTASLGSTLPGGLASVASRRHPGSSSGRVIVNVVPQRSANSSLRLPSPSLNSLAGAGREGDAAGDLGVPSGLASAASTSPRHSRTVGHLRPAGPPRPPSTGGAAERGAVLRPHASDSHLFGTSGNI